MAIALLLQRMEELGAQHKERVLRGVVPNTDITTFAIHHVEAKASSGEYSDNWVSTSETYLVRAVAYFTRYQYASSRNPEPRSRRRKLADIHPQDIAKFDQWLKTQPNGRGGLLGPQSRRHHLNALSGLFRRAISEGKLPMGSNPVAALRDKPTAPKSRTRWLEVDELALLLESAKTTVAERIRCDQPVSLPCAYELLAAFILTGAREGEIRQLQVSDLDFDSLTICITGTKTEHSDRCIPMHGQLRDILLPYVGRLGRSTGYLFTTPSGDPVGDWRKALDEIAIRAGFVEGEIRTRIFRTSYITHRLACLDHGVPIEPFQVAREVGHSSLNMIMRVYGRVQRRRVRMEEFAFTPQSIGPELAARLQALYAPRTEWERPDAKEQAALITRFLNAAAGMNSREIYAATGISVPSVNRIRAGLTTRVQRTTRTKIEKFLEEV